MTRTDLSTHYADFTASLSPDDQLFVNTYRLFSLGEKPEVPVADQERASELVLRGAIYVASGGSNGDSSGILLKIK